MTTNPTKSDAVVERGAERLRELSEAAARRGGVAGKLAQPLAEDAVFLRKLKPTLIKARIKGDAPTDEQPQPVAGPVPNREAKTQGGPNPFAVIGGAAGAGLALAKLIDWRGHAHPRR
jgi:hypothetical protein